MKVLNVPNVNAALFHGLNYLYMNGELEDSRAGKVLVAPCPVTTVYRSPQERVLFSPLRDANPFFHLFESLWMLAGRNDATWLDQFVGDFSKRFAEENGIIQGAYGHRWRTAMGFDQLDAIVDILKRDPTSRQCVLQMWDASSLISDDLLGQWKDRPCNTHVYFRIRQEQVLVPPDGGDHQEPVLDMTVCCRSNDIVWGAYGANAVHFSVLQEYMAARIGVKIGTYYQISNNYHVYQDLLYEFGKRKFVEALAPGFSKRVVFDIDDRYRNGAVVTPIVTHPEQFDMDLRYFFSGTPADSGLYTNPFFPEVACPLYAAHKLWREGDRKMAIAVASVLSDTTGPVSDLDWSIAAREWMARRMVKKGKLEDMSR